VLDHSGSMAGQKLDLCLQTLEFVLNEALSVNDRFGLVIFDTNVDVVQAPLKLNQNVKDKALSRIRAISAGSSTNLSGGLFAGIEQMMATGTSNVASIILLTDGLMNHGITDRGKLISMVNKLLSEFPDARRPSINCFGYGSDVDADLLSSIASASGGGFYSILNMEDVPLAFANVVGGLLSVVAQSIELHCILPTECQFIGQALTKFPQEATGAQALKIKIKDMFAGEQRDVLFKIKVSSGASPVEVKVSTKYLDILIEETMVAEAVATFSRCKGKPEDPVNPQIMRQLARFEVVEQIEKAKDCARRGSYSGATSELANAIAYSSNVMKKMGVNEDEDEMMGELMCDLQTLNTAMASSDAWKAKGQSKAMEVLDSHSNQRANKLFSANEDAMPSKSYNPYGTSAKTNMLSKAKKAFGMSES